MIIDSFFISEVFLEFQRFRGYLIVGRLNRPEIQRELPVNGVAGKIARFLSLVGKSGIRSGQDETLYERVALFERNRRFSELCSASQRDLGECSFEEECQIKHIRRTIEFFANVAGFEPTPALIGLIAAKSYKSVVSRNDLCKMRSEVFRQYRRIRDNYADAFFERPIPIPIGSRNAPQRIGSRVMRSLLNRFARGYFNSRSFESLIGSATELLDLPIVSEVLSKRFPKIDFMESEIEEVEISLIKLLTGSPLFRIITDNEKPSDHSTRISVVAFVFMNREFERICHRSELRHQA